MFHLTLTECNFAVLDEKKTTSKCGLWEQSKDRENDFSISVEHVEIEVLVVTRQQLLLNLLANGIPQTVYYIGDVKNKHFRKSVSKFRTALNINTQLIVGLSAHFLILYFFLVFHSVDINLEKVKI